MKGLTMMVAVLGLALAGCAPMAADEGGPATSREAAALPDDLLSAPGRPADAVAQDIERRPVEILRFFDVRPGQTVADIYAGQGYFAELLARAVGSTGTVYATDPDLLPADARAPINAVAQRNPNVRVLYGDIRAFDFPEPLDFALLSMSYHDVYFVSEQYGMGRMEPSTYLADLYDAMAPGGVVGVIDHVANPGGDVREVVDSVHRIDPAVLRRDFEAAGFRFEGESDALRNSADDHTKLVFDPAIRGHTDKIVYRFVKPAR